VEEINKIDESKANLTETNLTENSENQEESKNEEEISLRQRNVTSFLKKKSSVLLNHQDLDFKQLTLASKSK
jgi:hypothetical protein